MATSQPPVSGTQTMKRTYTMGRVQYTPSEQEILIPLQQVSPYPNSPLISCHATQDGLASLTPPDLSDRTRWSDREAKAFATAFVRMDEPDADVYTIEEWAAIQAQNASPSQPTDPNALLEAAAAIAGTGA